MAPGGPRQGLVGLDSRPVAARRVLPPYIPMDATLYLGKEDGWPYKLVLVGRKPSVLFETRRIGPDGRPVGAKSSIEKIVPSEITLAYKDVKFNTKLRPEEFAFQAPATEAVDDGTEALVKILDQAIQMELQQKKNDAAKKEGPVLDQPIDIPSPPDPTARLDLENDWHTRRATFPRHRALLAIPQSSPMIWSGNGRFRWS